MFLTNEILDQYEACGEGVRWFQRWFPDGAELTTVMNQRHIPISFLDWGFLHLPTSDEEKKRYFEIAEIVDSDQVFESHHITRSHIVTNSENISDSKYIYFSEDVSNTKNAARAKRVKNSKVLDNVSAVYDSVKVVSSSNVKNSYNISLSSYIIDSGDLFNCTLITKGYASMFCNNSSDIAFCAHCKNVNHCIFCYGLDSGEYMIFNQKLSKEQWDFIYEELKDLFANRNMELFDTWDKEDANHSARIIRNYMTMYMPIFEDKKVVNWVKNLPFYKDMLAYQITLNPNFLKEE